MSAQLSSGKHSGQDSGRASDPKSDDAIGGSLPQEKVEDRPNITPVSPEDYPEADRADSA